MHESCGSHAAHRLLVAGNREFLCRCSKINYQGKLTNAAGQLIDGTYSMTFKLYAAASGGTALWTETHTSNVVVTNGLFNVMLGSTTSLTSVFQANDALYLEIAIGTETLAPRQEMASVGYALRADKTSSEIAGGWTIANESWTYASSSSFSVIGDQTGKYQKGDKIKLTQTTAKYFYIIGISYSNPATTITITGGSGFSLADAAITDNYYSKCDNPQGFPRGLSLASTTAGEHQILQIVGGRACIDSWYASAGVPGPSTAYSVSISFGITFAEAPVVTGGFLGWNGNDPANIGDFQPPGTTEAYSVVITHITATGFDAYCHYPSVPNGTRVGFLWRAVGPL